MGDGSAPPRPSLPREGRLRGGGWGGRGGRGRGQVV